jgi:hypothetical protein
MNNISIEILNNIANGNQPDYFDILLSSNASFPICLSVADFNEKEFGSVIIEQKDISKIILEDEDFRESIMRAREQMRKGTNYLSHEEVFGE